MIPTDSSKPKDNPTTERERKGLDFLEEMNKEDGADDMLDDAIAYLDRALKEKGF